MPHTHTVYRIDNPLKLEAIWAYSMQRGLLMYKQRVEKQSVWLVQVPDTSVCTGFLLLYADSVTSLNNLNSCLADHYI